MPHITLPEGYPGIRGLFLYNPETARPLNDLVRKKLRALLNIAAKVQEDGEKVKPEDIAGR